MPAFGFASPWLLLGLGLAAIPILIHLLFRRPHREIPWAATRFLLAATKKHAKRLRLEQLVLLAVRLAILLLAATALARPFVGASSSRAGLEPLRHRVIVLDASYSMSHERGGRSRFDAARDAAREIIDAARPGEAFHLVRMTDLGARVVIGRPAYQPAVVAETLAEQTISYGRADPVVALREAKYLLRQAGDLPIKDVLIFSDFQQNDWQPGAEKGMELRRLLDEIANAATVRLFDAAGASSANAAVTDVALEGPFVRTARPFKVAATVRQHGQTPPRRERVELHADGRLVATEVIELRADADATVAFVHAFSELGPHSLEIRLPRDALPADDARFLALTVRDRLRVLLVNGRQEGRPEQSATYFVKRALSPFGSESAASEGDFEPVEIAEGELASQDLSGFDAVVLLNVGMLTDREADRLRSFASAGGGVVLALGDNVRPEAWNPFLADAGELGLLPVRLEERFGNPVAPERAIQFDTSELSHPIVRPFAGNPGTGLDVDFVLACSKTSFNEDSNAEVALRFDTGDPAIISAPLGGGRAVLVTTSLDTTWGGPWPQAGRSFLPLVHEIVRYAATGRPPGRSVRIGEPLSWTIPDRVAGLTANVAGPGDLTASVPASVGPEGMKLLYGPTEAPGVYTLTLEVPVSRSEMFAVNVDPEEGNLTALSQEGRMGLSPKAKALVPGLIARGTPNAPDWPLSRWLLAGVLGLLLAEQVLAWRFAWGLVALAAVAVTLITRGAWLVDPLLGAGVGLIGAAAVAAAAAWVRRRS